MMIFRKCCECGKYMGVKFASIPDFKHWFTTTHGLCETCLDLKLKELKLGGKNENND